MSSNDGMGSYGQVSTTDSMGASLVAPDPEDMAKPAAAVPMIEIVAPATLMEGYRLDTQVGDQIMTIIIPPGGVEKGQRFTVPMTATNTTVNNGNRLAAAFAGAGGTSGVQKTNVPVGHWKDGMLDCCRYGCCHASLCISFFCHALAAGQVISRLQLNWLGKSTNSHSQRASAFTTLFTISMVYFALKVMLFLIIIGPMPEEGSTAPSNPDTMTPFALLNDLVNYAYFFLSVVVIYNVRHFLRQKYAIPEQETCPTGCEDGCCAFFCPCLTVAQMMRHTTEYDTYRAECLSSSGLPDHVPALIV